MNITWDQIQLGATYAMIIVGAFTSLSLAFMRFAHFIKRVTDGTASKSDDGFGRGFVWVAESLHGTALKIKDLASFLAGGRR